MKSPWIVEGAGSALRPRGVGPSCAHVPGMCPAGWDLSFLGSPPRLLLARVPGRGSVHLLAGGPSAPSTESGRTARSSRPPAGLSRAAARDGSGFPTPPSIRQTLRRGAGLGPSCVLAALHRLWAVACGAARDATMGPRSLAPLTAIDGAGISSIGSALRTAPRAPAGAGAPPARLARRRRTANADRGGDRRRRVRRRGRPQTRPVSPPAAS